MLYYGDNLPILRNRDYFPSESVDLVYLDPPFNSNQDYNVLFAEQDGSRSAAQIQAFSDTWRWDASARRIFNETVEAGGKAAEALAAFRSLVGESDMLAYLSMMAPRLVELRRVLRPTGSIYLHCDPSSGHYLKLLMDRIFGPQNFRREIVWRSGWVSGFKANAPNWARNHDTIFYYVRDVDSGFIFNKDRAYKPHPEGYHRRGGGENPKGTAIDDVWDENSLYSPWIKSFSNEKLGYATQKPQALLDRIISVSSTEGSTVLDPFCGCGTTIASAQSLGRRWIGIDITHLAITLIRSRLADAYGDKVSYEVIGEPADFAGAEALAKQDRYQFQWWALGKIRARPVAEERKKGADSGIDGKLFFRERENGPVKTMVIQVKSGTLKLSEVRDFAQVIQREKAPIGVLLALDEPTRDMRAEAATLGYYRPDYRLSDDDRYDRYQILTIRELFDGKRPLYPPFRNVTFKAATVAKPLTTGPKTRTKKLSELVPEPLGDG